MSARNLKGTKAFRELEGIQFECTIVNHNSISNTVDIQYMDDGNFERNLSLNEVVEQQEIRPNYLVSLDSSLLCRILRYCNHIEIIQSVGLCKHFLSQILSSSSSLWTHLDLSSVHSNNTQLDKTINLLLHFLVNSSESGLNTKRREPLKRIVEVVSLKGLEVADTTILRLIRQCPNIHALNLQQCCFITDDLLNVLCDEGKCPRLQKIDLWLCPKISNTMVQQLRICNKKLQITHPGIFVFNLNETILSHIGFEHDNFCSVWEVMQLKNDIAISEFGLNKFDFLVLNDVAQKYLMSSIPFFCVRNEFGSTGKFLIFLSIEFLEKFLKQERRNSSKLHSKSLLYLEKAMTTCYRKMKNEAERENDSLEKRAEVVFKKLHTHKQHLEDQVNKLKTTVDSLRTQCNNAKVVYKKAQFCADEASKEIDRAVLTLMNPSLKPPTSGNINILSGDNILPEIPSNARLKILATTLEEEKFSVLDSFLGDDLCTKLYTDIVEIYKKNGDLEGDSASMRFQKGELGGGKTGKNLKYQMEKIRGDDILWADDQESNCPLSIKQAMRQFDRIILERLPSLIDELRNCALMRKRAMITCYPGNGSNYIKHCDNPNGNGRKITSILYLNKNWKEDCGGEIEISIGNHSTKKIEPIFDRLVIFFSDARVPHAVLPTNMERFAMTIWYLDWDEYTRTQLFDPVSNYEKQNIENEIRKFRMSESHEKKKKKNLGKKYVLE